jgi:hypothetical protein
VRRVGESKGTEQGERKRGREKERGTYKAVDLATFLNMTRYCGGYVFGLALVLDERADER